MHHIQRQFTSPPYAAQVGIVHTCTTIHVKHMHGRLVRKFCPVLSIAGWVGST